MINQLQKIIENYKFNMGKAPDFVNITPLQFAELKSELKDVSMFTHDNKDGFNYFNGVKLIILD